MTETPRTSFGFREVGLREKTDLVRGVFERVAPRYDLMNDLMSGGVHRLWKDAVAARLNPAPARPSSIAPAAPATSRDGSPSSPAAPRSGWAGRARGSW